MTMNGKSLKFWVLCFHVKNHVWTETCVFGSFLSPHPHPHLKRPSRAFSKHVREGRGKEPRVKDHVWSRD